MSDSGSVRTYHSDDTDDGDDDRSRSRSPSPEVSRERSPSPSPSPPRRAVKEVVKVLPYEEHHPPTPLTESKTMKIMKETTSQIDIDTRLVSFYKYDAGIKTEEYTDITYRDYIIHLNLDRLKELCNKPSRKLRTNQKRQFYYHTPMGQNVLHLLANYIRKSYTHNQEIYDITMRLLKWEHLDVTIVDQNGMNFFNYLIGGDSYITPYIADMYAYLLSRQIYPNYTEVAKEAALKQNVYPLWKLYYKTLTSKQTITLLGTVNCEDDYQIKEIHKRINFVGLSWDPLNQFMIFVYNHVPSYTLKFYDKIMDCVRAAGRCRGCVVPKFAGFLKLIVKKMTGAKSIKYLYTCESNGLFNVLFGSMKLFKVAIFDENFELASYMLDRFIDAGGLTYNHTKAFTELLQETDDYGRSCTKILIDKKQLEVIKQIISLSTSSFITEQLEIYLKKVRHTHKHTDGEYTCATCWEEYDATVEPGNTFTRCGHYPFCDKCYSKMTFCPFCYDQSEAGKAYDIIGEIAFFKETTFDPTTVKMWNVEHEMA